MVQRIALVPAAIAVWLLAAARVNAQENAPSGSIRVTPSELTLPIGEKARLSAEVLDVGGRPVEDARVVFFSRARRALRIDETGELEARQAGSFEVVVRALLPTGRGPETTVKVTVPQPEPAAIRLRWHGLDDAPTRLYTGTAVRVTGDVVDADAVARDDLAVAIASDAVDVAAIDAFGTVTALRPGRITLRATGGGLELSHDLEIVDNPVRALALRASAAVVRTGDVVQFETTLRDAAGATVDGVPVLYSFTAAPDDALGNAATGQIEQDGRFVAEQPGLYTVVATCGPASSRVTIRADERFAQKQKLELVGHGPVLDVHTSDLWVWEGNDGRDYCVTGTWGANGDAIFWDVTDPERIERIATVTVDARTVNDVKVSEDGRLCVISREGASNRKNGIVAFDVSDPHHPEKISEFDDELTGGVHNVFIHQGYVYALSAGRRYDILDARNPRAPVRVGSFQLFEPGASIHDVWVVDGIAYSSNWQYGLHLVDVGNGIKGGSPSNPVEIGSYAYPSGWNHAAFPWRSPDTGKFYVFAGDEAFPYGLYTKDHPTYARGWIHIVDFTDLEHPQEVARYEVPEAGTHNLWIEGNTMYVAYYNGGVRVVDVSGDLMGDLYRQGREIGFYLPTHPKGVVPNAPMVWGPQPHKGHVFFSDWNSGLWAVKLVDDERRRR
ncbi:MAG: hypothetical protein KDE27_03335 [Planctomycetes bacterium]|nr:hypothetical protein [Planctomycetota bacterium]